MRLTIIVKIYIILFSKIKLWQKEHINLKKEEELEFTDFDPE